MLLLYIIDIYNSSDKLSYYLSADDINLLNADNNLIFRFHRIRTCLKFEAKEVVVKRGQSGKLQTNGFLLASFYCI